MAAHPRDFDMQLKVLLIGDSGTGKTCLLLRYVDDRFSSSFITTIGIDFKVKTIPLDGQKVKLQIWDTAGQERFRTITTSYFRGAQAVALCFDLTDRKSFNNITNWTQQISEHADDNIALVLIANKADMEDKAVVKREEAEAIASKYGVRVFFTSAKLGSGVDEAFTFLAREGVKKVLASQPQAATGGKAGGGDTIKPSKDDVGKGGAAKCGC